MRLKTEIKKRWRTKETLLLFNNALEYINWTKDHEKKMAKIYRLIYNILSTITIFLAVFNGIMAAIFISKIFLSSVPDWYFFITTSATAIITLISSCLNFFIVHKKMIDFEERAIKIDKEIILYQLKIGDYADRDNADLVLFDYIFAIRSRGLFIKNLQRKLDD